MFVQLRVWWGGAEFQHGKYGDSRVRYFGSRKNRYKQNLWVSASKNTEGNRHWQLQLTITLT